MSDRVNAAMHGMKPPGGDPAIDRSATEPQCYELATGDDPVLTYRHLGDQPLVRATHPPTCATFAPYLMVYVAQVGHQRHDAL